MSVFRNISIAVALCASATVGLASSVPVEASTLITHRAYEAYPDYSRVVNYMEAVVHNEIVATVYQIGLYVTGMEAERAAQEAERIAAQARESARSATRSTINAPRPAPAPRPAAPTSSGGACGGATNGADQFIQRESGGSPTAANPSGAYGCYQIMPYVWAANCSDLGPEVGSSPAAQAACASRLPLSAWNL